MNIQPHKDKFEPRVKSCIFLGYQTGFKAFKVYDLATEKVIVSIDTIFHETKFPFLKYELNHDHCDFTSPCLPIISYLHDIDIIETHIPNHVTASLQAKSSSPSSGTVPTYSPIRHSDRCRKQPPWMCDFVINQILAYDLPYSSSLQFFAAHINFLEKLSDIIEPHTYTQASKSPQWVKAMETELDSL